MEAREGTGSVPLFARWCSIRLGPHPGCILRSSQIRASTSGSIWWGQNRGRCDRSASGEPSLFVAGDPGVDALTRDPQTPRHLHHPPTVLNDRQDRLVSLFHDGKLHEHGPTSSSSSSAGPRQGDGREADCQGSAEATVKDQPKQVSTISRSSVKSQLT